MAELDSRQMTVCECHMGRKDVIGMVHDKVSFIACLCEQQ